MYKTKMYPTETYPHFGQNVPKPKRTQFVTNTNNTLLHIFCTIKTKILETHGRKEMFYLMTLSKHLFTAIIYI